MEDMRTPDIQSSGIQNSDPRTINPKTPGSHRRQKVRWNYKRIVIALIILIAISAIAIYGGLSLAHKLINRSAGTRKVAVKAKKVASVPKQKPEAKQAKEIKKPGYIEYTVKSGDSLYAISLKYNTTVDKIRELNGIKKGDNLLSVGMVLKVPISGSENNQGAGTNAAPDTSIIKPSDKEITRGPTSAKKIALTFDVGSESGATPQILKALADANVNATFFLTGEWAEKNPELARSIAGGGNLIGNRTDTHPNLTKLTNSEIVKELESAENKIRKETGVSSKPLFRAPYGARDQRVLKVAASAGYRSVHWTVDSLDLSPSMTANQVKNRILANLSNGAIILEHCDSQQTAQILPSLIREIQARGYKIVTVPGLFE